MSFSHVSTIIDKFSDVETTSISIPATVVAGDVVLLDVTWRKTGGITLGSVQFNGSSLTQVGSDIDQGNTINAVYRGIAASSGTFNFTGTFSSFDYAIAAAIVMRPSSGGTVTVTNQNQNFSAGTFSAPSLTTTMASGDAVVSVLSGLGWDKDFNNVAASTWSATSPLTAQANGQNTGFLGVNRKYVATDVTSTGSAVQAWTVSAGQPQYSHNAIKLSQVATATLSTLDAATAVGGTGYIGTTANMAAITSLTNATITGTSTNAFTYSMNAFAHGVAYLKVGTPTFTASDGTLIATKASALATMSGYTAVTMGTMNTGDWSIGKDPAIVTNDVIHLPTAAGTLNTDGTLTDYVFGTYTMWRWEAATGIMYTSQLTVGDGGVEIGDGGITSAGLTSAGISEAGISS